MTDAFDKLYLLGKIMKAADDYMDRHPDRFRRRPLEWPTDADPPPGSPAQPVDGGSGVEGVDHAGHAPEGTYAPALSDGGPYLPNAPVMDNDGRQVEGYHVNVTHRVADVEQLAREKVTLGTGYKPFGTP